VHRRNYHHSKVLIVLWVFLAVLGLTSCGREAPSFAPGDVTVTSSPAGAGVFIDGTDTGQVTPFSFVGLDANLYNFSVQLPEFISTPTSLQVDLRPLDTINLEFTLSQTGLLITSEPAGATVFLDGTDSGHVTPATIAGLGAGPVEIALTLDTYLVTPASFTATVVADTVIAVPAETFAMRSQRTVILEGFGNINCGPCPQLTANLVAMADKPGFGLDRVIYLEFSVNWPNPADPLYLYNPVENSDRFTEYFVLGAPALYADGSGLPDALDAPAMEARVLAELEIDPGFRIDVTADFTNPSVPVTVTLLPAVGVDLTGSSLYVALYEDTIDFDARGLDPGTNGQTVFHHVFRDRVDTLPALGPLAANTPTSIDVTLARGDWAPENLVVVAIVQRDSDHAIIQAGSTDETAKAKGNPQ